MELFCSNDLLSNNYEIMTMLSLSQGTLKVDAGSRNLLRGLNILVAVDNSCEGGIILCELRMNFGPALPN
jgi:hypothetical protein